MSEKGFLVDSEKTWRTDEVGCMEIRSYLQQEREKGERENGLRKKKNNLLNEKEFDRSVFSKTDKLNLSWKLTVAKSDFASISWSWAGKLNHEGSAGPSAGPKEAKTENIRCGEPMRHGSLSIRREAKMDCRKIEGEW